MSLKPSFAYTIQEYYDAYYAGTSDSKEKTTSNDVGKDDKKVNDIFFPDWLKDFDNLEQKFGGVFDQVTAFTNHASPQNALFKKLFKRAAWQGHFNFASYVLIRTNEQLRTNLSQSCAL